MNIESEVKHFKELSALEQARFLARFMYELTLEARNFYRSTRTSCASSTKSSTVSPASSSRSSWTIRPGRRTT
jgi:hypothetical protein